MGLLSLPDDVLLEILGLLTAFEVSVCSLACRRLYELSLTPAIWLQISSNGNYGYMALFPHGVTPFASPPQLFKRVLSRAELSERQWAGLLPQQRPGIYQLGMCPLGHRPRGFMGKYYVEHNQTPVGAAVFRWYPVPGVDVAHSLEPVYTYALPQDEKYRPRFPPLPHYYKFRFANDTFIIAYGRQGEGDSKTTIHFTEVQCVEGRLQTPSELSVALPFPLTHGIIRWLDDDHLLVVDLDEVADQSTLIVERRSGKIVSIPRLQYYHLDSTPDFEQNAWTMDIVTNTLRFFVTPSYCVQALQRSRYYEVFELPRCASNVDSASESVLHAKRTPHTGRSSCKFYSIWHVQEHASILIVVGVTSTSLVSSQVALLRWNLTASTIEDFGLSHEFKVVAHSQLDYWSESVVALLLVRITFGSAPEFPKIYVTQLGGALGLESMPRIFETPDADELWDYGWIDKHRGQFGVSCTRDGVGTIWATTLF